MLTPFHLAIGVSDLKAAECFYRDVMGCPVGRRGQDWVDFNLMGHQLVCHRVPVLAQQFENPVDGDAVPVPHFGVVLTLSDFALLRDRLQKQGVEFVIEPTTRFVGEAGEQSIMFLRDPSGNAIEFKAFQNIETALFATE